MNEFRCGKCGWSATAWSVEGMLAASKFHREQGCIDNEESEAVSDD